MLPTTIFTTWSFQCSENVLTLTTGDLNWKPKLKLSGFEEPFSDGRGNFLSKFNDFQFWSEGRRKWKVYFYMVMVCLASVYGKWVVMEDKSWHFEVDKGKGGRMFYLRDGCTHEELLRMVQADYMLDMEPERVELLSITRCDAPSNAL
ncbi:unnamed protein product [Microthlaspi erraticum]|uniref:Uncharacterized protein n=1 Tax=Microthlaspi erraticum TaxID=1685480 RepID=A0A6D2JKE3_9BRAS|nr:unnamed protein product [Microthlaspi erraticum]